MTRFALWLCLAWAVSATASAQSIVTPPTKLSPFAGHFATPAQANIGFWGTDLGFAFKHKDKLWFLYGDSWADTQNTPIGMPGDDAVATLDFAQFSSGAKVEQWVNSHLLPVGFPWLAQSPPLSFPLQMNRKVAPIEVYDGDATGTRLGMSLNKTPMAGFSNARSDATSAAFAIMGQFTPVQCDSGTLACPAGQGLVCDTGLGLTAGTITDDPVPCVLGSSSSCLAVSGRGLCQDQTSSVYDNGPDGRIASVALQFQVGNADQDPAKLNKFYTRPWPTNKFINPALRTVKKFDPGTSPPTRIRRP